MYIYNTIYNYNFNNLLYIIHSLKSLKHPPFFFLQMKYSRETTKNIVIVNYS